MKMQTMTTMKMISTISFTNSYVLSIIHCVFVLYGSFNPRDYTLLPILGQMIGNLNEKKKWRDLAQVKF